MRGSLIIVLFFIIKLSYGRSCCGALGPYGPPGSYEITTLEAECHNTLGWYNVQLYHKAGWIDFINAVNTCADEYVKRYKNSNRNGAISVCATCLSNWVPYSCCPGDINLKEAACNDIDESLTFIKNACISPFNRIKK